MHWLSPICLFVFCTYWIYEGLVSSCLLLCTFLAYGAPNRLSFVLAYGAPNRLSFVLAYPTVLFFGYYFIVHGRFDHGFISEVAGTLLSSFDIMNLLNIHIAGYTFLLC